MTWNWAAGSRAGSDLAIQFGGKWTTGTGQTDWRPGGWKGSRAQVEFTAEEAHNRW